MIYAGGLGAIEEPRRREGAKTDAKGAGRQSPGLRVEDEHRADISDNQQREQHASGFTWREEAGHDHHRKQTNAGKAALRKSNAEGGERGEQPFLRTERREHERKTGFQPQRCEASGGFTLLCEGQAPGTPCFTEQPSREIRTKIQPPATEWPRRADVPPRTIF